MLHYHYYDTVSSTQDIAQQFINDHANIHDPHIFIANQQTGGKGRRANIWHSPSGHFYGSFILAKQPNPVKQSFICGLSLYRAISSMDSKHTYHIKWPNDIYQNGKKTAGLLLQLHGGYVIAGMGINCAYNITPSALDDDKGYAIIANDDFTDVAQRIYDFYQYYHLWEWDKIIDCWRRYHLPLHTKMVVGHGRYIGLYHDIEDDGSLCLMVNGKKHYVMADDVGLI